MANSTKKALEASLKKLLKEKPFDKITIADLTGDCGISRMTFYYHFQDIYELAEWVCIEDGKQALKDKKTYDTWQEGMIQVFEAVLENKPFIVNIYRSVDKAKKERKEYSVTGSDHDEAVEPEAKFVKISFVCPRVVNWKPS